MPQVDPDIVSGRGFWNRMRAYRAGRDHGPRPPAHIVSALRRHDSALRLFWHPSAIDTVTGCWCVWRLTRRYVPHGTAVVKDPDGGDPLKVSIVEALEVPQLVMRVKPGFLSLDIVQAVKDGDMWRRGKDRIVDDAEKSEALATKAVENRSADAYAEGWTDWHRLDTPHSYVPKNYGS